MNQIQEVKKQTMLQVTNAWVKKLNAFADASSLKFDDYQKEIVVNTVRKLQESGFDIMQYEQNNIADILYQTSFLRLNPSALPKHCYFIERKIYDSGKVVGKKIEMGIEGEGNDEILRNFGVGIRRDSKNEAVGVHKVWIIREFDDFEDGYYNGIEYTPPKWRQKPTPIGKKKGRVIKVVYPIERTDGQVEYWSADRADLQPIILKHIEQNLSSFARANKERFNEIMSELKELSFDEILETYGDTVLSFKAWGKDQEARMISDSYVGSTGEAMIIRKLRNLATRTYPKNFNTTVIEKIYESTFEERYDKPAIETVIKENLSLEMEQNAGKKQVLEVEDEQEFDEPITSKANRQTKQTDSKNKQQVEEIIKEEDEVDGKIILNPHDKVKQMIDAQVIDDNGEEITHGIDSEIDSDIDDDLDNLFD